MRVFRALVLITLFCPLPLSAASSQASQWYVAGSRLYAQGQYSQALQDFGYSLRLDNTQAAAYQAVGSCYYALREPALALRYYQYSLRLNPSNAALQAAVQRMQASQSDPLAQGEALYQARRYNEALSAFQAVAAQQPQNARAFQSVGNCQYALGDLNAALTAYKQALALNPSNTALSDFVSRLTAARAAKLASEPRDWVQPLWRSVLVPGWGQGYNGQDTKGWILGSSYWALWIATIATYEVGTQAEDKYMGLGPNLSQATYNSPYDTWATMAEINHITYITLGVVWVYSLIDAVVNARPDQNLADLQVPELPGNTQLTLLDHGIGLSWKVAEF